MRKKIYAVVLAGILVFAQSAVVMARPVHVALDGFLLNLRHGAVVVDGRTMVDITDAVEIFGEASVLGITATDINGRTMVPVRDAANISRLAISWDDENGLVRLSSANPDYGLLDRGDIGQATVTMSYNEALERINSRDARLLAMEENMIIIEREQREINDYLSDNNIRGRDRRSYTVPEVRMLRAREAMRNQIKSLEINAGLIREGNEMQLRNILADIERVTPDIALIERQLAVEEQNLVIIELMYNLGMESETGLRDARSGLGRTRTNLENLRTSLENHRLALNAFLGVASYETVKITDLSWDFGNRATLNTHITNQMATAPNLTLLQMDLDYAEYVFFSYDVLLKRDEQDGYYRYRGHRQDASVVIEMRNDINAATRALNDAQDNLERRIRSLYNDIEALREQQRIAQNDLTNAIEDYREVMLRYMTGMATWLELERAKLAILNHEAAIARHNINLGMLTLLYQRPYLN